MTTITRAVSLLLVSHFFHSCLPCVLQSNLHSRPSLYNGHFFLLADGPYVHSYFNLSIMAPFLSPRLPLRTGSTVFLISKMSRHILKNAPTNIRKYQADYNSAEKKRPKYRLLRNLFNSMIWSTKLTETGLFHSQTVCCATWKTRIVFGRKECVHEI